MPDLPTLERPDTSQPDTELERLKLVKATFPTITPDRARRLDKLALLAAQLCHTPVALVTLVGRDRQAFVGRFGTELDGIPIDQSFCAHAIRSKDECMVVGDASTDPRFAANPLVTGAPGVRFYAGQPLVTASGLVLGTLCVIDGVGRTGLTEGQRDALKILASMGMTLLDEWREEEAASADRARADSLVFEMQQKFDVLADVLPQLVWSSTPDGLSDYFNRQWCEFTGAGAERSFGTGWLDFLHPEDAPVAKRVWNEAVAESRDYEVRYRLRNAAGDYRWVLARGLPLRDRLGEIIRWIGTCTDIHDEVETADAVELLSQELNHRIKNIFAVVGGLVSLTSRNHPEAQAFATDLYHRILALGRAHSFVGTRGTSGDRDAPAGLKAMLHQVLAPYDPAGGKRIVITGQDIAIDDRSATPLSLFYHELATNSAKHGALANEDAHVVIEIGSSVVEGETIADLVWIERGIVPPAADKPAGFGSRLIDMSINRQLGGKLETRWGESELRVTARIPVANLRRG